MRVGDKTIGSALTEVLGQLAEYSQGEHESSGPAGAVTFMKDNFDMPRKALHDSLLQLEKEGCISGVSWPDGEPWATATVTAKGVALLAPEPGNG